MRFQNDKSPNDKTNPEYRLWIPQINSPGLFKNVNVMNDKKKKQVWNYSRINRLKEITNKYNAYSLDFFFYNLDFNLNKKANINDIM